MRFKKTLVSLTLSFWIGLESCVQKIDYDGSKVFYSHSRKEYLVCKPKQVIETLDGFTLLELGGKYFIHDKKAVFYPRKGEPYQEPLPVIFELPVPHSILKQDFDADGKGDIAFVYRLTDTMIFVDVWFGNGIRIPKSFFEMPLEEDILSGTALVSI